MIELSFLWNIILSFADPWNNIANIAERWRNAHFTFDKLITGVTLGEDSLWGSIYAKPADFFSDHRTSDSMNRNCSIMRAAKGDNVSIGHYFPGMIREAISEARKTLATMPKVRAA